MRKSKIIKILLVVLLIITVNVLWFLKVYSLFNQTKADTDTINNLVAQLDNSNKVTAYQLAKDVEYNQAIESTDLYPVDINSMYAAGLVTSIDEIKDKVYKVSLKKDALLSLSTLADDLTYDSSRELDVMVDMVPIGIEEGDYIDIRLTLPFGEDYRVMKHKRVIQVNKDVLKVKVEEDDVISYSSLLSDRYRYTGMQVYATVYLEGQKATEEDNFYPVTEYALSAMLMNPNIKMTVEQSNQILAQRKLFEESLNLTIDTENDRDGTPAYKAQLIDTGKKALEEKIKAGQAYRTEQNRLEAEAKENTQ